MDELQRCGICHGTLINSLVIENVPDSTFDVTDKTITLNVAECSECGAVQLIDVPLTDDYDISKHSIGFSSARREFERTTLGLFIHDYDLLDKELTEVGCGDGQYITLFAEMLLDVKGFQKIDQVGGRYDCAFTFYYLEHLPDPVDFIIKLYNKLNPNGLVYIEVPDYDYIVERGVWVEFTRDHRFYYGKQSITYLLSMCGFKIEEVIQDKGCMTVIARKPNTDTLIKLKEEMDSNLLYFTSMINNLLEQYGKFYIYGAGHCSLLLLKSTGVTPEAIFDANPKKVGKVNEVDVKIGGMVIGVPDNEPIVVICGYYNDEVIKMLRELGKKNIIDWRY